MTLTLQDRLLEFEETLELYAINLGLNKLLYNKEVEKVLDLTEGQIRQIDRQLAIEYTHLLAQYAGCIQREVNKHKIRLLWAESELNKLIAKYQSKYTSKYMKFDIIKATIIQSDSAANSLDQIILIAKSHLLLLEDIVANITLRTRILEGKRYETK